MTAFSPLATPFGPICLSHNVDAFATCGVLDAQGRHSALAAQYAAPFLPALCIAVSPVINSPSMVPVSTTIAAAYGTGGNETRGSSVPPEIPVPKSGS